jgi:alpha-D-ribose 1-methylphosphonate 5-triphosphate synthase subunit PhnG
VLRHASVIRFRQQALAKRLDRIAMDIVEQSRTRREAMALLARASRDELERPLAGHWPQVQVRELKPAEAGLVMVRGRIGGDGAPFNLGEASVTRCVVEMPNGVRGFAFALGRDRAHARAAAILDAIWQDDGERPAVERNVLAPIAARLAAAKARTMAETAATRVDFFTMVRAEGAAP